MPRLEPALAKRIGALTGDDPACCVADYKAEAKDARAKPAFALALARAKAMSDEKRLTALALLKRRGEMCACEIQAALELTHGTVSHHMATLEAARLVVGEKRGKWVHYALHPDAEEVIP